MVHIKKNLKKKISLAKGKGGLGRDGVGVWD